MKNSNHAAAQIMSTVVKRLKASGLTEAVIEKAIDAVKGCGGTIPPSQKITNGTKTKLFKLVKEYGPLVLTGKGALQVFTLAGYDSRRRNASIGASTKASMISRICTPEAEPGPRVES